MTERRGRFFTFEGADGAGKTTQMAVLAARLESEGYAVLRTQEPGGTNIGRQIRSVLLDARNNDLRPTAELLLYFAARAQNFEELILPGCDDGKIVLCDRFTDSTLAYQGGGRGLDRQAILQLHQVACGGQQPDRTLYLDLDLPTALNRARARNDQRRDRMEEQSAEFYARVRANYLALANAEPERIAVVDGQGTQEEVAVRVWAAIASSLPPKQ